MDLANFNLAAKAEAGASLTILNPIDGTETDLVINVAGSESATYRNAVFAASSEYTYKEDDELKDKIDVIDKRNGVTYAACIMGWENMAFNGKPVEFSHDEAAKILADTPWLTDQIGVFIKNRANFM